MRANLTPKDIQRFWSYVDRRDDAACWPWIGASDRQGYGVMTITRSNKWWTERAHRISAVISLGHIPDDKPVIMHLCDNPSCCNPTHLRPGTLTDNNRDRTNKNRNGQTGKRGEAHRDAKLTEDDVREIRRCAANGVSYHEMGRQYGVSATSIESAVKRKTWKHVD